MTVYIKEYKHNLRPIKEIQNAKAQAWAESPVTEKKKGFNIEMRVAVNWVCCPSCKTSGR